MDPAISKDKKDKTAKKTTKNKAIIEKKNATKKRIQESLTEDTEEELFKDFIHEE